MKIEYINFGIGNRTGDTVYLHEGLKKYPKLHKAILEHEKKHTGSGWSYKDLILDVGNNDLKGMKGMYWKFMFQHPSSFLNLLPILRIKGKWYLDLNLVFFWVFTLFLLIFVFILI